MAIIDKEKIQLIKDLGLQIHKIYSNGEVQCKCIFHEDKSPSLMVNVKTNKFQCFSCGLKGHSFEDFVKKISGEEIDFGSREDWNKSFKEKLYPKIEYARQPSIPILPLALKNPGETYLLSSKRKLDTSIIRKFNVKYWESENAVVVPIEDIGYMARYIDTKKFKYISGTKVNDRLFGLSKLDVSIYNYIMLVEGCFDVMWLHKCGYTNSLAIMHGDLSDTQKKILGWYQLPVYIMMDNDKTGEGDKIRDRIIKKLKGEFRIKVCTLPQFKDPNECATEELQESIINAK